MFEIETESILIYTGEENGAVFGGEFSDEGDDIIGDMESEVMRTTTSTPRTRLSVDCTHNTTHTHTHIRYSRAHTIRHTHTHTHTLTKCTHTHTHSLPPLPTLPPGTLPSPPILSYSWTTMPPPALVPFPCHRTGMRTERGGASSRPVWYSSYTYRWALNVT